MHTIWFQFELWDNPMLPAAFRRQTRQMLFEMPARCPIAILDALGDKGIARAMWLRTARELKRDEAFVDGKFVLHSKFLHWHITT
jgi:hypothetical protein